MHINYSALCFCTRCTNRRGRVKTVRKWLHERDPVLMMITAATPLATPLAAAPDFKTDCVIYVSRLMLLWLSVYCLKYGGSRYTIEPTQCAIKLYISIDLIYSSWLFFIFAPRSTPFYLRFLLFCYFMVFIHFTCYSSVVVVPRCFPCRSI